MKYMELIAPCHFGMEAVLKREILDLGYEISKEMCIRDRSIHEAHILRLFWETEHKGLFLSEPSAYLSEAEHSRQKQSQDQSS